MALVLVAAITTENSPSAGVACQFGQSDYLPRPRTGQSTLFGSGKAKRASQVRNRLPVTAADMTRESMAKCLRQCCANATQEIKRRQASIKSALVWPLWSG